MSFDSFKQGGERVEMFPAFDRYHKVYPISEVDLIKKIEEYGRENCVIAFLKKDSNKVSIAKPDLVQDIDKLTSKIWTESEREIDGSGTQRPMIRLYVKKDAMSNKNDKIEI